MIRTVLIYVLLAVPVLGIKAQKTVLKEQGSWFTLTHNIKVSSKLSIDHISQMRRVDHFENMQVLMLKPSVNYTFNNSLTAGLGYVYFRSFPNGVRHAAIKKSEQRIWQHVTLKSALGAANLSNRLIFEQRFKDIVNTTTLPHSIDGTSYAQRLRYRLLSSFKVAKLSEKIVLWAKVSNEIRIRFKGGLSNGEFDQNNLYGFLGIGLSDNSKFWLGYGRDYKKVNSDLFIAHDIIHFSMSYDLDLSKKS